MSGENTCVHLKVSCLTSYNNQQYKRKLQRIYNNVTL